jgi:hypothetical protein
MIVTVVYGWVRDLDAARRCQRCDHGVERHGALAGQPCPRCHGSGIRPDGWTYLAPPGIELALGDLVQCPPTPYSRGVPVVATVVDLAGEAFPGKTLKEIIGRAEVTS